MCMTLLYKANIAVNSVTSWLYALIFLPVNQTIICLQALWVIPPYLPDLTVLCWFPGLNRMDWHITTKTFNSLNGIIFIFVWKLLGIFTRPIRWRRTDFPQSWGCSCISFLMRLARVRREADFLSWTGKLLQQWADIISKTSDSYVQIRLFSIPRVHRPC